MDTEKKIRFTGEDSSLSSTFQRLRKEAQQMNSEWIGSAQKQNLSSKEQISFLQQQITLLERKARIERDLSKIESRERYSERMASAKTPEQKRAVREEFSGDMPKILSDFNETKILVENLRQLLSDLKGNFKERDKISKDEGNVNKDRIKQADDQWRTKKSLWEQEVREDRKNVQKKIRKGEAGFIGRMMGKEDFEGMPIDQAQKLYYQRSIIGDKDKKESFFGSLLKAEFVKEAINSLRGAASTALNAQDENSLTPLVFGAAARSGSGWAAAIPYVGAGLAAMGNVAADILQNAKERELSSIKERDISSSKLNALTGRGGFSAVEMGFTTAQLADVAKQVALSGGGIRGLESRTRNLVGLEIGYGLERNNLLESERISRMTGTSTSEQVGGLVGVGRSMGIFRNGNYSQLNELVQIQNNFLKEQSRLLNSPDSAIATRIIAGFRQLGGAFGDARLGDLLPKVSNNLINPSNQFQQARSFSVLSQLNPGADYYDILGMQEKGLGQKGYFGGLLKGLEKNYGSGKALKLAVKSQFGFSNDQTDALVNQYLADRNRFDNFSGADSDFAKQFGGSIQSRAEEILPEVSKSAARIQEAFTKSFTEGMSESLKEGGNKFVDELMKMLGEQVEKKNTTKKK